MIIAGNDISTLAQNTQNSVQLSLPSISNRKVCCLCFSLGLSSEMLAKIINTSSGRCWSSDTYNPVPGIIDGIPSSRQYAGGFGSALMAKVGNVIAVVVLLLLLLCFCIFLYNISLCVYIGSGFGSDGSQGE